MCSFNAYIYRERDSSKQSMVFLRNLDFLYEFIVCRPHPYDEYGKYCEYGEYGEAGGCGDYGEYGEYGECGEYGEYGESGGYVVSS